MRCATHRGTVASTGESTAYRRVSGAISISRAACGLTTVRSAGSDTRCVLCFWLCGVLLRRDMPVGATDLLGSFDSLHFLPSCWAGAAPCSMSTFAYCASRCESFHILLLAVLCLVRLGAIVASLRCVTLSANVAIVLAAEALHHFAGAVVELALAYLALLRHAGVDDGVGRF
jgi:hypothetical protein